MHTQGSTPTQPDPDLGQLYLIPVESVIRNTLDDDEGYLDFDMHEAKLAPLRDKVLLVQAANDHMAWLSAAAMLGGLLNFGAEMNEARGAKLLVVDPFTS